ncbi:MAG TPA: hypothetical protein DD640_01100 [Clostridiales bacterium]|nr:hypothetical protein [Clostridiales bacterium]
MKKTHQPRYVPSGTTGGTHAKPAGNGHHLSAQPPQGGTGKNRRQRAKQTKPGTRRTARIAAVTLAALLLVVALGGYLVWRHMVGKINVINPSDETLPSEFNVPTESLVNPIPTEKGIINILLLGVDTLNEDSFEERSDSMMILTIDEINGKIKLTSLQRDMLVYIPGRSEPNKINAANSLGGPLLAMRVVNETFRLSIENYAVINMNGMEKMIDLAGGVMVDVQPKELPYLNEIALGMNRTYPNTPPTTALESSGLQKLNGRQAVAYSRIRKLDSDYKRMARQRTVLQALFTEFLKTEMNTQINLISEGLGLITTNISKTRITEIGLKVIPLMSGEIDQLQIPIAGYFTEYSGSSWVNLCDYNGMIPLLQEFIFGKTYPFDPVKVIPGAPNSGTVLPAVTPKTTTTAQTPTTGKTEPAPTETTEPNAATSQETDSTTGATTTESKQTTTIPTETAAPTPETTTTAAVSGT